MAEEEEEEAHQQAPGGSLHALSQGTDAEGAFVSGVRTRMRDGLKQAFDSIFAGRR